MTVFNLNVLLKMWNISLGYVRVVCVVYVLVYTYY